MSANAEIVVLGSDLEECEQIIGDYVASFDRAGQALLDIYERELWRDGVWLSFEEYVQDRWQFKKARAHQLIAFGRFVRELSTVVDDRSKLPASERHMRPLLKIKGKDNAHSWQKRVEAWQVVLDTAKNNGVAVTEALVDSVAHRYYRGGEKAKPEREFSLRDLTLAFETIADSGLTPADAVAKFGHSTLWASFDDALEWMLAASRIDTDEPPL